MPRHSATRGKADLTAFPCESAQCLRCCVNGAIVEGRVDNVRGLDLRRSLDKSRHRLQHLWIGIGVVSLGVDFVVPQTDRGHINPAWASECDFVLKTILF